MYVRKHTECHYSDEWNIYTNFLSYFPTTWEYIFDALVLLMPLLLFFLSVCLEYFFSFFWAKTLTQTQIFRHTIKHSNANISEDDKKWILYRIYKLYRTQQTTRSSTWDTYSQLLQFRSIMCECAKLFVYVCDCTISPFPRFSIV